MLVTSSFPLSEFAIVEATSTTSAGTPTNANKPLPLPEGFVGNVYAETSHTITLPVVKQPEPIVVAKAPPVAKKTSNFTVSSGDQSGEAIKLYPDKTNNCVSYAKSQTGIDGTLGNGARAAAKSQEPRVGAIGSLKGSVHAVVIIKIEGNQITFKESNYIKNFVTKRTLPRSSFLGFINP